MTDPAEPDETEEVNEVKTTTPDAAKRDELLLAELKQALARSRHPHEDKLIADAQDAFSFLAVHDEFAALVFDSLWEDKLETTSRAVTTIRTLAFESAEISLEIEVSADGVVGQVSPAGAATVEAERANGRRSSVDTDDFGSFTLLTPGSGPMRFHVSRGAEGVVTDWFNAAG